jgi:hypothetical protein
MSDVTNLRDTIIPKSDQLNAEQLLGGPITITVTAVSRGTDDQPVVVHYEGDNGHPYKPNKSMRKVLIFAWGEDGSQWVGRSMTLFNKPDVKFGGVVVGGIRISHMSHIERDIQLSLTATKGKKEPLVIGKLAPQVDGLAKVKADLAAAADAGTASLLTAWKALPATTRKKMGNACPDDLKTRAAQADADAAAATPQAEPAGQEAGTGNWV